MHYLKCAHCGFHNPFKTEFLTFCGSCTRKLIPNYPEWIRENPEKSVRDFRVLYCVDSPTISVGAKYSFLNKKRLIRIGIATGILLIVLYATGSFRGVFFPDETPSRILTSDWVKFTYGKYGLSVESPVKLTSREVKSPPGYEQFIFDMESFAYDPPEGFNVIVSSILYNEGTRVNLEGAATGTINELFNQPGITQVEFNQSPISYNDVRGILLEGTYFEKGVFSRFECALYARKSNLWQVFVNYRADDGNGKVAAERVMGSIEINYYIRNI